MDGYLKSLVKRYTEFEEEILKYIEAVYMQNDQECRCSDRAVFKYIHEGDFDEIMEICLNCGGCILDG